MEKLFVVRYVPEAEHTFVNDINVVFLKACTEDWETVASFVECIDKVINAVIISQK